MLLYANLEQVNGYCIRNFCTGLKSKEQECPCDFLLVVLLALLLLGWKKCRQRLGESGADDRNCA